MPQTAMIKSLPAAFRMMKAMQAEGLEWGEDYRQGARDAVAELLRGRMDQLIDQHLERMAELGQADRRNGCYTRWLLTEFGMIELRVPRTRTCSALKVVRAYARRAKDVDRLILGASFGSVAELRAAIDAFINAYNATATPFQWRKPAVRPKGLASRITDL